MILALLIRVFRYLVEVEVETIKERIRREREQN